MGKGNGPAAAKGDTVHARITTYIVVDGDQLQIVGKENEECTFVVGKAAVRAWNFVESNMMHGSKARFIAHSKLVHRTYL